MYKKILGFCLLLVLVGWALGYGLSRRSDRTAAPAPVQAAAVPQPEKTLMPPQTPASASAKPPDPKLAAERARLYPELDKMMKRSEQARLDAAKSGLQMLTATGSDGQLRLLSQTLGLSPAQQDAASLYLKARDRLRQLQPLVLKTLAPGAEPLAAEAAYHMPQAQPMRSLMPGQMLPGSVRAGMPAMKRTSLDAQIAQLEDLTRQMKQVRDLREKFMKSLTESQTAQVSAIPDMDAF